MFQSTLHIRIDLRSAGLDSDDILILLFHQHGHFVEHLSELGQGLFDLFNVVISLLDFTKGTSGITVSVRVEEL